MDPDTESVLIVDEKNSVIGTASRREMRERKLIHRASYILVFNSKNELFLQKRTLSKDIYPGYYDIAAGGVVLAGEKKDKAAQRELFEELGIVPGKLSYLFDHYYADDHNKVWGWVYSCIHDGPFTLQKEEIAEGSFVPVHTVLKMTAEHPFTPDGLEILHRYLKEFHRK